MLNGQRITSENYLNTIRLMAESLPFLGEHAESSRIT